MSLCRVCNRYLGRTDTELVRMAQTSARGDGFDLFSSSDTALALALVSTNLCLWQGGENFKHIEIDGSSSVSMVSGGAHWRMLTWLKHKIDIRILILILILRKKTVGGRSLHHQNCLILSTNHISFDQPTLSVPCLTWFFLSKETYWGFQDVQKSIAITTCKPTSIADFLTLTWIW